MKPLVPAILALFVLAPLAAIAVEPPACPGGTVPKTWSGGSSMQMFCERRDGTKHGPYVSVFTVTNLVEERGEYIAGNKHGAWTRYDARSGKIAETGTYREGMQHGWFTTYHPNGKIASTGERSRGRQRGRWSYYDEQGRLSEEGEFRDGRKHGLWTVYTAGKVTKTIDFADGVERRR